MESTMADNTSVDLARVAGDNPVAASPDLLRAMVTIPSQQPATVNHQG